MSILCLIRHGQASAHKADYDQLSDLGFEQSRLAGQALKQWMPEPTAIWVGPCKRHRQTAEQLLHHKSPEPHWDVPFLDEFPAFELMHHGLGQLKMLRPELSEMIDSIDGVLGLEGSAYAVVLKAITQEWVVGNITDDRWISGPAFLERLQLGLEQLLSLPGQHLVVTSTGTIASLIGLALEASPQRAIRSAWALQNASISVIKYNGVKDRYLAVMNRVDHLTPELQSTL